MERYKCVVCGFLYDPNEGDQASGIEPGIFFYELPSDYTCPVCGAGKDDFVLNE
jgi:rubredoxin